MSDPAAGLPAWLRLDWRSPVSIRAIQLVFDTGMHRPLTLSHHDGFTAQMIWGRPQPETVRDYTIEAFDGRAWTTLVQVTDNYQRVNRHTLPTPPASCLAIRIDIRQTQGLDHARICEVRVEAA